MYTYKYPRPALTADCLVVGIGNDGCQDQEKYS